MYAKWVDTEKDTREIDVEVGSILYHTEHLHVNWYPHEIIGFYEEGYPLMVYSFDKHACNAIMYANGVDEKGGNARSLPDYSTDLRDFQQVIDWTRRHGGFISIWIKPDACIVSVQKSEEDIAVEYKAHASGITLDDSDIALAACQAFVVAYKQKDEE
jgi:hypothetical protein